MSMPKQQDQALLRRHAAAMNIVGELEPEERGVKLLTMVLLGSPLIDAAVEAAEAEGRPFPRAKVGQGARSRVVAV